VPQPASQEQAAAAGITVSIQGMAFDTTTLTVKAGETVTWINNDVAPHTVTSTDGGALASPTLNRGGSYSMTFEQPGTYAYYCKFHPNMRATVVVE
jgi:amicyanin